MIVCFKFNQNKMKLDKLAKAFVFILSIYFATALTPPSSSKQYRNDYVYNRKTDAFYKIHIESAEYNRARDTCAAEGGSLMVPATDADVAQAHALFKQYPDLGIFLVVGTDGATHESAEEESMIRFTDSSEEYDMEEGMMDVLTRNGEIETYRRFHALPFICKVLARDAPYNAQCDVYSAGYVYNATVGRSRYKVSTMAVPWGQAASQCEAEGAHLAVINSNSEHEALWEVVKRAPSEYKRALSSWHFFIGVKAMIVEPSKEIVFKTIFNETLEQASYNEWSSKNPCRRPKYCGVVVKTDGKLSAICCAFNCPFLCEKEIHKPTM